MHFQGVLATGGRALPEQMAVVETARLTIDPFISQKCQKGVEGGLKGRKSHAMLEAEETTRHVPPSPFTQINSVSTFVPRFDSEW